MHPHFVFSRNIRYLVECSKIKSISGAAKTLHVSQSTVSLAIKQLEDDLGFDLLVRSKGKGGLHLTPKAEALVNKVSEQMKDMDSLLAEGTEQDTPLKIATVPYFGRKFLIPSIEKLQLSGRCNFFFVRGASAEKALYSGKVDLAFFSAKTRPSRNTKLCYEIRKEEVGIVGLAKRFKHIEKVKNLQDLVNEPWVVGDRKREDWNLSLEGKNGCYWVDDHFSARSLVLEGHAIAPFQLDYFSEDELKQLTVSEVKIPSEGLKLFGLLAKGLTPEKNNVAQTIIKSVKKY